MREGWVAECSPEYTIKGSSEILARVTARNGFTDGLLSVLEGHHVVDHDDCRGVPVRGWFRLRFRQETAD